MSAVVNDYMVAKDIVKESLQNNPDASIFLAKAQKNIVLSALLKGYANKIQEVSDNHSITGEMQIARDGQMISGMLRAQADMILYSVTSRVRDSWSQGGEEELEEGKKIFSAQKILSTPIRIVSSDSDLIVAYGDLSRFMIKNEPEGLVEKERKMLFRAKTSVPLTCSMVSKSVLNTLKIKGKDTSSVFLAYFKGRIQK